MWAEVALVLGAYLFGSLPFVYALGRLRGVDLRREGDMHIGLWRRVGRVEGLFGILGDFVKGALPVVVARSLDLPLPIIALAGLAAVSGQMWSLFLRFRGEKGNSTGLAMVLALGPQPLLIAAVPMLLGVALRTTPRLLNGSQSLNERLKFGGPPSHSLPLGMAATFALLPLSSWYQGQPAVMTLAYLTLFILIMAKRVTAGLKGDLKADARLKTILINRILYDRNGLEVS